MSRQIHSIQSEQCIPQTETFDYVCEFICDYADSEKAVVVCDGKTYGVK